MITFGIILPHIFVTNTREVDLTIPISQTRKQKPRDAMAAGEVGDGQCEAEVAHPAPEVDHLIFSLQMCTVSWCWAPGFAGQVRSRAG